LPTFESSCGLSIFAHLFERTSAKKILKFLDEETPLYEDLQIEMKMPPNNFIKAEF